MSGTMSTQGMGAGLKQWFIVHTYSGFEKKVAESLRQRAKAYGLEDHIGRIEIPTEEVVEMKGGKKVQTATRFFPGYILVEVRAELRKVTWPGRKEVYATTLVVMATTVFFGFYLWGLDLVFSRVLSQVLKR